MLPKIVAPGTCPYPAAHEPLKMAKSIVAADCLLWGTDVPFASTQDSYGHLINYLTKGGAFTEEELEKTCYQKQSGCISTSKKAQAAYSLSTMPIGLFFW